VRWVGSPVGYHPPVVHPWVVSLELTRDDGVALDDDGLGQLSDQLAAAGMRPVLSRPDPGTVLAQMTVAARSDMEALSAAEDALRNGANAVWSAQGLPPFTISTVSTARADDRPGEEGGP
jgi:hypothetical protein